jgi:hypothetical protein
VDAGDSNAHDKQLRLGRARAAIRPPS